MLELFENEAPQSVGNFINLVEKGFYNGIALHRVIHEFMAKEAIPTVTAPAAPAITSWTRRIRKIAACTSAALSMAHSGVKNSGGSQFFITFCPTYQLDGKAISSKVEQHPHTVFGRVVEGFDVLPKLQKRDTSSNPHGSASGPLPPADKIIEAKVLRKRNHPYEPTKLPEPKIISGK
ncbi:MAG: peptidylprolyl isomerase [Pirellulales bacterium]